jgi:O-glycosyl hydrolase
MIPATRSGVCRLSAACLLTLVLTFALYGLSGTAAPQIGQPAYAQGGTTVTVDSTTRYQVIDGFGTCLTGSEAQQPWWQALYYDDLRASILRVDLTPRFVAPYSDHRYNSPWGNDPPLPGPDDNNVRTYGGPDDYSDEYAGRQAPIAVMQADANENLDLFNYEDVLPRTGGIAAQAGLSHVEQLGDFKLVGSIWSPPPWLKISSGNVITNQVDPRPRNGTPWPFIWNGNFSGGRLDLTDKTWPMFNDGIEDTTALTQFVRATSSYILGYQRRYGVPFYAISLQNELNLEMFYNSATYPLSADYIKTLKRLRAEFDKYDELRPIKIMGPEDLMGPNVYGMWRAGQGTVDKNLRHLQNIRADPAADAALAFFNIHSYAGDTIASADAPPNQWNWWANGWTASPAPGIDANVSGFTAYEKKSWMTETSGEHPAWLWPDDSFPGRGGWSIALKMHRALTTGQQSGWLYWQLTNTQPITGPTLTDNVLLANSPKYTAFKHFARYIRPNAQRVAADVAGSPTLNASAYIHDADQTLTVVLVNSSPTTQTVTVRLPDTPANIGGMQVFTSSSGNLWQAGGAPVDDGSVMVTVPGYGVTTLYGAGTPQIATTPSLPPCPTLAMPIATPIGSSPRAFLPLLRRDGGYCR